MLLACFSLQAILAVFFLGESSKNIYWDWSAPLDVIWHESILIKLFRIFVNTIYGWFLMKWLNLPGFVSTEESLCVCVCVCVCMYNFDGLESTLCSDS